MYRRGADGKLYAVTPEETEDVIFRSDEGRFKPLTQEQIADLRAGKKVLRELQPTPDVLEAQEDIRLWRQSYKNPGSLTPEQRMRAGRGAWLESFQKQNQLPPLPDVINTEGRGMHSWFTPDEYQQYLRGRNRAARLRGAGAVDDLARLGKKAVSKADDVLDLRKALGVGGAAAALGLAGLEKLRGRKNAEIKKAELARKEMRAAPFKRPDADGTRTIDASNYVPEYLRPKIPKAPGIGTMLKDFITNPYVDTALMVPGAFERSQYWNDRADRETPGGASYGTKVMNNLGAFGEEFNDALSLGGWDYYHYGPDASPNLKAFLSLFQSHENGKAEEAIGVDTRAGRAPGY